MCLLGTEYLASPLFLIILKLKKRYPKQTFIFRKKKQQKKILESKFSKSFQSLILLFHCFKAYFLIIISSIEKFVELFEKNSYFSFHKAYVIIIRKCLLKNKINYLLDISSIEILIKYS